jgi:hypothetical protein
MTGWHEWPAQVEDFVSEQRSEAISSPQTEIASSPAAPRNDTSPRFADMLLGQTARSRADGQRPLATVVIGGILTSTLLTLIVLPCLYEWIEERVLRRRQN